MLIINKVIYLKCYTFLSKKMSDTTPDTTSRDTRNETSRLNKNFISVIKNDLKNKNSEIFNEYFGYLTPFLLADLFKVNHVKSNQTVNHSNNSINELKNSIIKIKNPKNENPNKVIDIVEKTLKFNNQQKCTGITILTPKQMLQRLPIALASQNR